MKVLITSALMTILFLGCTQDSTSETSNKPVDSSNKLKTQVNQKIPIKTVEEVALEQLQAHKAKILKKWKEPEIHTNKVWVQYSQDFNRKTKVDFAKENITVEIIVNKNSNTKSFPKIINKKIYEILTLTTETATNYNKELDVETSKPNDSNPPEIDFLVADIFSINSKEEAHYKSNLIFGESKITNRKAKSKDHIIITTKFPFPKDGLDAKARKYKNTIVKHANKNNIPINLVYAIVKIESRFNPMARSRVPAYGLMQIVPRTSGRDITKHLEGHARNLSPRELYNGYKNIEYGSAYLNLLYYRYLNKISDPTTRLYCTIAAYNTGTGNVAKVFTGHTNIASASTIINKLSSEEVYQRLITRLPYTETRHYLKTVRGYLYEYE